MAYTNNVPQGNQQIATTQPIIQANFGFLQTGIGTEHKFTAAGTGTDMYHLQASMPNKSISPVPSLPAGTNGQYCVSSGSAYFLDATSAWRLNTFQETLSGTYTTPNSSSFTNIVLLPANVVGMIVLYNATDAIQSGWFFTDASKAYGVSNRMKLNSIPDDYPIELRNTSASLNLQGRPFNSTWQNKLFNYRVWYRPV